MYDSDDKFEESYILSNFTKPIVSESNNNSNEKPKTISVILVLQERLTDTNEVLKIRYHDREKYDEVIIVPYFINNTEKDSNTGIYQTTHSTELKEALDKLKKSPPQTGLLSVMTHSDSIDLELEDIYDPELHAQILIDHDICEADLHETIVKYEGCKAAQASKKSDQNSRALIFFDKLHQAGLGNVIGEAKNEFTVNSMNNILPLNKEDFKLKLKKLENKLELVEEELSVLIEFNSSIKEIEQKEKELLLVKNAINKLYETSESKSLQIEKGDSVVITEALDLSGNEYNTHPRLTENDDIGTFRYSTFFRLPTKTPDSKIETITSLQRLTEACDRIKKLIFQEGLQRVLKFKR